MWTLRRPPLRSPEVLRGCLRRRGPRGRTEWTSASPLLSILRALRFFGRRGALEVLGAGCAPFEGPRSGGALETEGLAKRGLAWTLKRKENI